MKFEARQDEGSKGSEKLLELQEKFFGPKPQYLSSGLDAWLTTCDSQAEKGIGGLKKHPRFEIFYEGMAAYAHQEPKDIGAVFATLKELGKLSDGEKLLTKREFSEVGGIVTPEFEQLFANLSDSDLKKAGASFYGGRSLDENLKAIAKLGITPSMMDPQGFLAWRKQDYDVCRRELDEKEFELLLEALNSSAISYDFYIEHKDEFILGTMTEKDRAENKRLRDQAESAGENWWTHFCAVVEKEGEK